MLSNTTNRLSQYKPRVQLTVDDTEVTIYNKIHTAIYGDYTKLLQTSTRCDMPRQYHRCASCGNDGHFLKWLWG